jgi:hypothetical protein
MMIFYSLEPCPGCGAKNVADCACDSQENDEEAEAKADIERENEYWQRIGKKN